MIPAHRGAEFAAIAEGFAQGLIGTISFGVERLPEGTLVIAQTTDAIVEFPQDDGTSNYRATRTMPVDVEPSSSAISYQTAWGGVAVAGQEEIVVSPALGIRPTREEVAVIISSYARSDETGGVGEFDASTNPTADQVDEFITHAVTELTLKLPDELDPEVEAFARRLAAIRAAMFVIVALQSDQDSSEDSAYDRLKDLYDDGWAALQLQLGKNAGGVRVGSQALESPYTGPVAVMNPADPDA